VLFDGWTSFFRDRVMPWRIGMAERMRLQFERETLPHYIAIQRWYASKGTAIERARVVDHALWEVDGMSWMLPILQLDLQHLGTPVESTYFLPLALAWEDLGEERLAHLTSAALAKVRQQANVGVMGDAFHDEAFCRAMVQAIGAGVELPTAQGRLLFRPTAVFASVAGDDMATLPVSRPGAMSSNTFVTLDERLFLKGYRRLRPGLNPELEMGRFLTEVAGYPHCVPVAGALEYFGNDGSVMTLALVQAYVPNQGSGWDYTLGYVERFLELQRTAELDVPEDAHGGFLALAHTLGQRTAELHGALSTRSGNPAFDPERVVADDLLAWRHRASDEAISTLALLRERLPDLPAAVQQEALALLALQAALMARIATQGSAEATGFKTRYHGDFHLGQVLVTGNDFVLIDFEGEPARTFDERRTKGPALRDVAGMLRSFNYARWSALKRVAINAEERTRLGVAAHEWELAKRTAFLAGYQGVCHCGGPRCRTAGALRAGKGLLRIALRTEQPGRLGPGADARHPDPYRLATARPSRPPSLPRTASWKASAFNSSRPGSCFIRSAHFSRAC